MVLGEKHGTNYLPCTIAGIVICDSWYESYGIIKSMGTAYMH